MANSNMSSGSFPSSSCSGAVIRGIGLSNTVHSDVAPTLPLPSLPAFCGAADPEIRLFENAIAGEDNLWCLDRNDILSQSARIAELLRNTDVSYINLRDDAMPNSFDCVAPLELHNQILSYNPRAFDCAAPASDYVEHAKDNSRRSNWQKSNAEPSILYSNQLQQDVDDPRKHLHVSPNRGVLTRKPKLNKGEINGVSSVTHDPVDIQDTIIENICHLIDDLCAKAEISSEHRDEAEFFSLPASDLVMFVSEISSIRSKKLIHLVPGDYLVKLLRVMDHQIHRAEGMSAEDGDHSSSIVCALEAIHVILAVMANNNMPKVIYKEEIIERVLEFSKHQLNDVMSSCDPSYRAMHNPGEFAVPEEDVDDENDIDYGSASKRRRTTKTSKYKKSTSNRVSGKINSILQKLCTILGLMRELLLTERLSDSCILQLVKTCFTTFMVDNIQLLQLKSISLLNGIFYKYIQHRVHIIDETVQLLWKLPISKRAQRAYHLPDEEHRQIQMVSALLIHFVHSSANVPDALRQASTVSSLLEISFDLSQVAKCHESATETCCLFWSRILQRLTTAKNQDASEMKIMMENLVSDLLTTLNLPEYPATIPILEVLCVLLLQNAVFKAKDMSIRLMAIDLLGNVATRLKQDSVVCRQNRFWASFEIDNTSDIDQKDGKLACSVCSDGKFDNSILKCDDCHRLFHLECIEVAEHENSGKAWNCPICVCKKQLRLLLSYCKSQCLDKEKKINENSKSSDLITNVEIVQQIVFNCLQDVASSDDMQLFVRWFYLCLWYKDSSTFQQNLHYHLARLKSNSIFRGPGVTPLNRVSLRNLTSVIGQNSSFCRGFDKILHMILATLMEASPVIRAKALRAVSIIVEADPEVLCDKRVQSAVEGRFCDSAISVREAALELVGRHIASHPDVGLKYFEKVAERIKDTGVSVRKRSIKIIRDMCTSNTNFAEFSTACIEIISRVSDDESSIQDLVCKTFYEFWFEDSPGSSTQYCNDGSSIPLEVAKKTEQIVEVSRKMTSHQLLITIIKRNLALDFFPQAAKAAGINPVILASVRKRCELMCQFLLEKILQVEETKANEIEACALPYVLVLHSFCSVDASLCVPASDPSQFVVTLQPYLKTQADNRGTAQLLESIIYIIDSVLTLIRKLPKSVVDELEQDLKNLIVRHPFLTVVHASIKCLCSLSKIVGHGAAVVEYLINVFFKRLEAQGSDNNKQLIGRSLFCLGLLLRYGNSLLNCSPNKETDIFKCLDLFKRFVAVEDSSVNIRSLQALGYVLIAKPELMLEKEIGNIIETTLSSAINVRFKMQSLQNMYEYLLDAESQLGGEKIPDMPPPSVMQSVPVAAGAGDTNICGGIVQLYWDLILTRCLDPQGQIRQTALKIVEIVLRQGLVHPITSVPYLIALETDPDEKNSKLAHHLLTNMNEKYPAFFESRLGDGLQLSYVFIEAIRTAVPDTSNTEARLGVSRIYKLIRGNRMSRNKFMSSIIRKFDIPCNSSTPAISFLIYCTEILALLPFTLPDEPLYLVYTINRIIQVRAGALEANMKGLILLLSQNNQQPYTLSSDETLQIQVDCITATALELLLKLKRHLKIVYALNDARCQAFSPNEPPKPGEALSKQTVPFDIGRTSTQEPSSYQDLFQRYQEFKNALKEDTADYVTYTANIRKKRATPRKVKSGRVADEEGDEDDGNWTAGNRKVSHGRKANTGRRR